jgi:hypothetical protein
MTSVIRGIVLVTVAAPMLAQQPAPRGGTITGTVRDSAGLVIADADIIARPGGHRTRTDSAGRFSLTELDGGNYTIASRKVGFAPDRWDVKLSRNGKLDLKFVLARQRQQLDTIVVTAKRDCPAYSLDGFMCRRRTGGGVFLDYPDIDDQRVMFTGDLFRNMPGFRAELRPTAIGSVVVPVAANGYGCINSLVDGRPATAANPVPTYPSDLSALEVYLKPDSVPRAYQRYTWPASNSARSGRCSVIVYWTIWARYYAR